MALINYANKVALNQNSGIANINKCNASDMNEIKEALNNQVGSGWYKVDANLVFSYLTYSSALKTGVFDTNLDARPYLTAGMKMKFTQNSTVKYGIITAISGTQIRIFMGQNYVLESAPITNLYFSMVRIPYGFPMNPDIWTLKYEATAITQVVSPVINQWYNIGSLTVPMGCWEISYNITIATTSFETSANRCYVTLGTTSNAMGGAGCMTGMNSGYSEAISLAPATNSLIVDLTLTNTTYYLTAMTNQNATSLVDVFANGTKTTIKAKCAYL